MEHSIILRSTYTTAKHSQCCIQRGIQVVSEQEGSGSLKPHPSQGCGLSDSGYAHAHSLKVPRGSLICLAETESVSGEFKPNTVVLLLDTS